MDDELLTTKGACEYLQISYTTLWRLKNSGDLAYIQRGVYLRFRKSDLNDYLDRFTHKKGGENE